MEVAILFFLVIAMLIIGVPIAISLGLSSIMFLLVISDTSLASIAQSFFQAMAGHYTLLAIPFFILSGYIMAQGGIANRLINFAKVIVSSLPGGLAYVNIIACMFFGAISGSAAAATSAVGGVMIPSMNKEGYDKNFSTALTVTASTTGLLIPPSNILIIYSLASGGVSISALFIAGYMPGLLIGLGLIFDFSPDMIKAMSCMRRSSCRN